MKTIYGKDINYPLLDLAEAYVYRSAFTVDWASHRTWEIHFVLSGTIVYEIDGCGTCELHGGTFLAIPPNVRHRTKNGSASPSKRLAMRWNQTLLKSKVRLDSLVLRRNDVSHLLEDLSRTRIGAKAMSRDALRSTNRFFTEIENIVRKPDETSSAILRHGCNEMLLNLILTTRLPQPARGNDDVVSSMRKYIDEHLGEKIQMKDLTKISGYGATQLTKLFLEQTGTTARDYIVRARIRKANELLQGPNEIKISEVAAACGFGSASYFSTVYRKYCGVIPSFTCYREGDKTSRATASTARKERATLKTAVASRGNHRQDGSKKARG